MRILITILLLSSTVHAAEFPSAQWAKAAPSEAGLDETKLNDARDYALTGGGSGCIIRGGKRVYSWGDQAQRYDLKSTTKSFGATALGLAVADGKGRLEDEARAPRDRLRERVAYEFFTGFDDDRAAQWSRDIAQRGAVFTNPGACYRSGITYNAALRRYLWCQIGQGEDTRYSGGFAIYDAPEPWGPWTTAFATDEWDVGPGETGSFPTKWMSADGRTLNYVSSGNDSFSARKATLMLKAADAATPSAHSPK